MKKVKYNTRQSVITAEHLACKMNIEFLNSKNIMRETTQKVIIISVHPITRRYRVDHSDLHTSILAGKWYVDWILAGTESLAQNAGYFLLAGGTFTKLHPSESK